MSDQNTRAGHLSRMHLDALGTIRENTSFLWKCLIKLPAEDDRMVCQVREKTYGTIRDALVTLEKAGYFKVSVRSEEIQKGRGDRTKSPVLLLSLEDITAEFKRNVVPYFKQLSDDLLDISIPEEHVVVRELNEMSAKPGSFAVSNSAPLALSEIIPASRYYPVLFAKGGEGELLAPVALLSLSSADGNADADGSWTTPFVPYCARQSLDPVEFLRSLENTSGEAKINATGNVKQEDAHWRFKKELKAAAKLAALLHNKLELCDAAEGIECADDYRVVSNDRLAELPKKKFVGLRDKGLLPYVYALLNSLEHLHDLQLRARLPKQPILKFERSVTAYPVETGSIEKRLLPLSYLPQKLVNAHVWMWRIAGVVALLLVANMGWTTFFSSPGFSEPETVSVRGSSLAIQHEPGQSKLMDGMPGQRNNGTEKDVSYGAGHLTERMSRKIEKPAEKLTKIITGERALEEAPQNAAEQNTSVPEAFPPAITQSETVPAALPLKSAGSVKEKKQQKLVTPQQTMSTDGQVKVAESVPMNSSLTFISFQKTIPSLTNRTKDQKRQLDTELLESDRLGPAINKPDSVASFSIEESPSKVKVATDILNMRILPGLQQTIVTKLEKGTVLKVVGLENAWLQVETSDGKTGWVVGYLTTDFSTGRHVQSSL